jgi:predicted kinase
VQGTLIIVCGLPGAGKTTLALRLEQERRAIRLSADEWMFALGSNVWDKNLRNHVEALQGKLALEWVALGHTVVIEWGTWERRERDALRLGAREKGARVELYFLDAALALLMSRVRDRGRESPAVTMDHMLQWDAMFERPDAAEFALYDVAVDVREA